MAPSRIPAPDADPSPLGQSLHFEFSGKAAPNRFLKGAMTERLSSWDLKEVQKRGIPSKELINMYRRWGEGGLGLIVTGNVMLYYDQLEARGNSVIPRDAPFFDERFQAFSDLAAQAKAHGSLIVAQLSHPGRQAPDSIQPYPVSASDVHLEGTALGSTFAKPRAMTKEEIRDVVDRFGYAAEYLHRAGYDGVQIHGAHGYLIAQFLSQTTNKRTDEYGGPLPNRARLVFEIVDEIRRRVPDGAFVVGVKLNSVEFQHGGFTPAECGDLCAALEGRGVDFVELSGGTYQRLAFSHRRESSARREAFFLEFADAIAPRLARTRVYVTGGFRTTAAMVAALGPAHGVGLARPLAHEFDLARKLLEGGAKSAADYGIDEQDFALSLIAAGTQMRLVGRDKEPLELGRPEHRAAFDTALRQFEKEMENDRDGSRYGFMDIDGIKLEPYGTPYETG
ncbi:putative oxidoreductase [Rosellinia necatrix]|uniref:Putative oxidoreductase n=1 Tax=Rosellinia necatrix TaxID=77044 RepID=A0A1W2TFJ7_ROSNE|nr:putative oxidoreductase [Rosellinia necatrix]